MDKKNKILVEALLIGVFVMSNYISKCSGYVRGIKVMMNAYPDVYKKNSEETEL